jgi:hypothetical protein
MDERQPAKIVAIALENVKRIEEWPVAPDSSLWMFGQPSWSRHTIWPSRIATESVGQFVPEQLPRLEPMAVARYERAAVPVDVREGAKTCAPGASTPRPFPDQRDRDLMALTEP